MLCAQRLEDPKLSEIDEYCVRRRAATRRAIAHTVERGVMRGEFKRDTDVEALAEFLMSVLRGMSAQAEDGATRQELERTADHATIVLDAYRQREAAKGQRSAAC